MTVAAASQMQLRALQIIYASNEMERAQQHHGVNSWAACGPYVASVVSTSGPIVAQCIPYSQLLELRMAAAQRLHTGIRCRQHSHGKARLYWLDHCRVRSGKLSLVSTSIFTRSLTFRSQWLARGIVESLAWLDSWPVGLKLNTELSSFFHLGFLAITRIFACKSSTPARKRT